jgi:hypothetical protein
MAQSRQNERSEKESPKKSLDMVRFVKFRLSRFAGGNPGGKDRPEGRGITHRYKPCKERVCNLKQTFTVVIAFLFAPVQGGDFSYIQASVNKYVEKHSNK